MINGHLLNDRYKIKRMIGGGGMANVYLARDTILDRDVAVKALRMEYANDPEFIARFDREAQAASILSHPNIVSIYDVGEEDDVLYMVMEYVDGMTLKEYIQNYSPIYVEDALDIMKQITSAISHAHENEIVHRDIKPQNILIDTYGTVKVTDFGIAVALSATSLTQTNAILGSVHYLSPEQARGGSATKKSDIYSIGIVLFELLTGRLPFSGQSPVSIALKHLQSDTPSIKRFNQDVPQSVENIVLKSTSKDPFHRYDTVYAIEQALDTALDPDKINEKPYKPPIEAGEETKAIPIITDNQFDENIDQQTLVHQTNGTTKNYPEEKELNNQENGKTNQKKKKNKKRKKKKTWVFLTILILLTSAALAIFLIPTLLQPDDISMPDVIEMEYEEAEEVLENNNLVVEQEFVYSDEIEEGYVVRSDPAPNSMVQEESEVNVYVSQGQETVTFDDYLGQDYSQVERLLEGEGYNVIAYEKYSDRPVGEIVTQIQPDAGNEVVPSETRVIFEISNGPELVTLNNLKGMTKEEANDYLENQGLMINVIEENSENVPAGEVIRQSPDTGTELEKGTTVDVYLSIGPEEEPPVSHTISYTVPYNKETDEENENNDDNSDDAENEEEEKEKEEQTVRIYIGDANNDLSEVFMEETITEDTEFTFTLTIAPDSEAEYVIMRDDETVTNKTVSYEEGGE